MMKHNQNNIGITPPISLKFPEEFEERASTKLIAILKEFNQYESEEEAYMR